LTFDEPGPRRAHRVGWRIVIFAAESGNGDLPDSGIEGDGIGEGGKTGEGEAGPASGTTEGDDAVGIAPASRAARRDRRRRSRSPRSPHRGARGS